MAILGWLKGKIRERELGSACGAYSEKSKRLFDLTVEEFGQKIKGKCPCTDGEGRNEGMVH